ISRVRTNHPYQLARMSTRGRSRKQSPYRRMVGSAHDARWCWARSGSFVNRMSSGSNPSAQQKWAPIVLRFPEKYTAHGPAKTSYKATILFFPHRRSSGSLLTMAQQRQSDQSEIAKWLTFKTVVPCK